MMTQVKVITGFWDRVAKVHRTPGETFEVAGRRAEQIAERLPGYVELTRLEPDYDSMTKAELVVILQRMGVAIPKSANKAKLIELIRG